MNRRVKTLVFFWMSCLLIIPGLKGTDNPTDQGETDNLMSKIDPSECSSIYVMEYDSGDVIFAQNEHERRSPASMVKMMLLYIVFDKIESGEISLTDILKTSAHASNMGGSQVYLKHNEEFTLKELLQAVIVKSANDAAMSIAEYIGGSSQGFVDLMNLKAAELSLENTHFETPHGLPPSKGQKSDYSSAHDLAILGRTLIQRFPELTEWGDVETMGFRNDEFIMTNTNRMIGSFEGCDGIKTGYHQDAGYCITATAVRDGVRIISVVMGCRGSKERFNEASRFLTLGFNLYSRRNVIQKGIIIDADIPVIDGEELQIKPVTAEDLELVLRNDKTDKIIKKTRLIKELTAPVQKGKQCGSIEILLDDKVLGAVDLIVGQDIDEVSFWGKILRAVGLN